MMLYIVTVFEDGAEELVQHSYAIAAHDEEEAYAIALEKAKEDEVPSPKIDHEMSFACTVAGGCDGKVFDVVLRDS
jgi:hypothetical protein